MRKYFLQKITATNTPKKYSNMSASNFNESTENSFSFEPSQAGIETEDALIFEEISRELEAFLARESSNKDSTDGAFNFWASISGSVQEKFEELISGDSNKKQFLRAFSRIFALLLNTKVVTAKKIKGILKIAIETTLKIWKEPRQ